MARPREHLSNAPIVEAIIDFRVPRLENVTPDIFSSLETSIGERYSNKSPIQLFQGAFGVDNGRLLDPTQSQVEWGWRYQAENEVAQFRVDGFTFNKLVPYTSWDEVFTEAFRLWEIYRRFAKPTEVSRLAVRYINRMQLPGIDAIGRYLEAPPTIPAPIPQLFREFLTRVYVDDEATGASAVIVQALEKSIDPNSFSILLDIDAFHDVQLLPDDPSLPRIFNRLRILKNDIFYASVTERTVEIYA